MKLSMILNNYYVPYNMGNLEGGCQPLHADITTILYVLEVLLQPCLCQPASLPWVEICVSGCSNKNKLQLQF